MHKNTGAIIFMVILILLLGFALVRPAFSPTGKAVFIEQLCTSDTDCNDGEVCCLFSEQNSGVCDYQDSCDKVMGATDVEKLPFMSSPGPRNPTLFYGAIVIMFALVFVLAYVFYKKAR